MKKENSSYNEKYSIDIIKMIRNNNIAIGPDSMENYNTYFMLDYFDLLFHRNLAGDEKIYREFWNIRDNQGRKTFSYKAAYKTLSLYADKDMVDMDFFKVKGDEGKIGLSSRPFLGIVQVDLVYCEYSKEPSAEQILLECEKQIVKCLEKNGFCRGGEVCYQIYRSSTSGDFCLVVKSAYIRDIYKISSLINNFAFVCQGETYKFSTYTNIGIECLKDEKGCFCTFQEETIDKNSKCKFALRITTCNAFAKTLFENITENKDIRVVMEPMEGLFGRYDFLVLLSMAEFSKLYAILCESKIIGSKDAIFSETKDKFLDSFQAGVVSGDIEIINERVLVPLTDEGFELMSEGCCAEKGNQKHIVEKTNDMLRKKLREFQQLIDLFVEERRAYIDVSRELGEVISTYVPQGVENDSHVNWQILVSDLEVVFAGIDAWKESYEVETNRAERKAMRVKFIEEIRLVTEALNQYYKFLQNVNAQTWQAPLYEIQTQLDAEKMMIAYREFLYQYLRRYKKHYENSPDKRPMRYPIVYPDLSAENVYVMVAFQNEKNLCKQLFVCKVPSFEYYGRMFDMIPWILHEASHCIRVLSRVGRNEYLIRAVFQEIFSQAFYKLLNYHSNDYGYHELGKLENDVLECIVQSAYIEFQSFCQNRKNEDGELVLERLETELLEFLYIIFEQKINQLEREEDAANVEEIQKALLRQLGRLGLLDREKDDLSWKVIVEESVNRADMLFQLFEEIYNAFYWRMTGMEPEADEWKIIISQDADFEEKLGKVCDSLENAGIGKAHTQDYCFSVREMNRLYGAWFKRRKDKDNGDIRDGLWRGCIDKIRSTVKAGFQNNQGFLDLYRILNMVFDNENMEGDDTVRKIGKEFDRLLQEEVFDLTERVVKLYRESIADIFMAEALGLNAFGYCRHMFQTASDASIGNSVDWAEAINIHRFRSVAAVLLVQEHGAEVRQSGKKKIISMEILLTEGEKYCCFTLDCAKKKIEAQLEEKGEQEKKSSLDKLFDLVKRQVKGVFQCFMQPIMLVRDALEDSVLVPIIEPKRFDEHREGETAEKRNEARIEYETVRDEMQKFTHVFYRVKSFISILELVGKDGYIVIDDEEYRHFNDIYVDYREVCRKMREEEICEVVSHYYNEPQSAKDKSSAEMLEDTLRFIQMYYYKNRFKIMSSLKKHLGGEEDGKTDYS